jgi:hypothetical protein
MDYSPFPDKIIIIQFTENSKPVIEKAYSITQVLLDHGYAYDFKPYSVGVAPAH